MISGLFQPMHLVVILVVLLIVLGPSKLPQFGASLGKALRELRRSLDTSDHSDGQAENK
ncbi:twin-arginine translocase TatA/TatE family subunit [Desulfovibrio sp.]